MDKPDNVFDKCWIQHINDAFYRVTIRFERIDSHDREREKAFDEVQEFLRSTG